MAFLQPRFMLLAILNTTSRLTKLTETFHVLNKRKDIPKLGGACLTVYHKGRRVIFSLPWEWLGHARTGSCTGDPGNTQ